MRGQAQRAARLLGAAGVLMRVRRTDSRRSFDADREAIASAVRAELDEKTFAAAWEEGRSLAENDWERVVAYALEGEDM